jgi:hypothetical protein
VVVTPAALSQLNPDVLIFSDTAGATSTFTPAEQDAIAVFLALGGKRIIGTALTFENTGIDNRWLLPYFGLTPGLSMTYGPNAAQSITFANPAHPLAVGLPSTMPMTGFFFSQLPADLSWDSNDFTDQLVASSLNARNILHHYRGQNHEAIYVSFMPEYGGDFYARQLIYNCITAALPTLPTLTPLAPPSIGTVFPISAQSTDHPNAAYLVGFASSNSPGVLLSDGRLIPLNLDPLLQLSLTPNNGIFLHNSGFLNGTGVANAWVTVSIPALPSLVGQTLYAAMITLDSTAVTGVGGISNVLPIVILN